MPELHLLVVEVVLDAESRVGLVPYPEVILVRRVRLPSAVPSRGDGSSVGAIYRQGYFQNIVMVTYEYRDLLDQQLLTH